MRRIDVAIAGVTPLLMNRMPDEQLLALHCGDRRKFKARGEPRDEATQKVYRARDGSPYLPTENLMACLIAAGVYIKLDGKRQMSTKQSTLLPGFLTIEDPYLPLLNCDGAPATWEVDMRQGRNPNGGEAVCVIRPRFDRWGLGTSFLVDSESVHEDTIRELVDIAGSRIGLGDFRPQRRGVFGKFKVITWSTKESET